MSLKPHSSNLIPYQPISWQWLEKPLTGLVLTIALILFTNQFYHSKAEGAEVPLSMSSSGSITPTSVIAPL